MNTRTKLLKNFLSLSSLQMLNYVLPLITLPYLLRILGPSNYGFVAFAQSFTQILIMITDYGFNLTATKQIALNKSDFGKISQISSSVYFLKLLFTILGFIILVALTLSFNKFGAHSLLFFCFFGMVIGQSLIPLWFFQGIEQMAFITVLNVIAKGLFSLCLFIFIHNRNDYLLVPVFNSAGFMLSGIIAISVLVFKFKVKLRLPSYDEVKNQLFEGWHVFISTLAISFYTASNSFLLGLFTNSVVVGYYASAEKLINASTSIIMPFSQTVFPHISQLIERSKEQALVFVRKALYFIGGLTLLVSIGLFVLAPLIVKLLFGEGYSPSIVVLRILSLIPFLVGISNILGIQTMIPMGYNKAFSNILIIASIVNILLNISLIPILSENGTALSVLITETLVTLGMYLYLNKKGYRFFFLLSKIRRGE